MTQFITAEEAAALISDNAAVAVGGHLGFGTPDGLFKALRERYDQIRHPENLTLIKMATVGDGHTRGCDRLAADGLIGTVITSHLGLEPKLARHIGQNKCFAYTLPAGTILKLYRAIAAGEKAVWTDVGLHTMADPRLEGGKANEKTRREGKEIASVVSIDGDEYLQYRTFPIHVCLIRGSFADEDGNISLQREAMTGEQLEIAAATHNSGGIVIVQVEDVVPRGSLDPRLVALHRFLVDYVVISRPKYHRQSFSQYIYRPELIRQGKIRTDKCVSLPLDNRKVCARRALMEIRRGDLINLGIGIPEAIGYAAAEEGFGSDLILSSDSGVIGGSPLSGLDMGAAIHPEATLKTADMFNLCCGGALNVCALGMAEIDGLGNVNVSKFNGRVIGPGGFMDLAQNSKKILLMGTFTAGNLQEVCADGKLTIVREGTYKKFKKSVEQITFSGEYAAKRDQHVLIITERAVFRLTVEGLMLTEVAPGIDIERDILRQMEFKPLICDTLRYMDERIFKEGRMGIKDTVMK